MKILEDAILFLCDVITGDDSIARYRKGHELVAFFNQHGAKDTYGDGFPGRQQYVIGKLYEANGTPPLKGIVEAAFNSSFATDHEAEDSAYRFTRICAKSGYKLVKRPADPFYWKGAYHHPLPSFQVLEHKSQIYSPPKILLDDDSLLEYVEKARSRIEQADHSGAISICYTLIEGFLKLALKDAGVDFNQDEGDVRKLYKSYSRAAGLLMSEETPDPLKPLLSGLVALVGGFYVIANKAGDRHQRRFKPDAHHARLVVSLTFAFCEFLVESKRQRVNLKKSA